LKNEDKRFRGIVPIAKSIWYGQPIVPSEYRGEGFVTQTAWQYLTSEYTFNSPKLKYLLETGYGQNPEVYSAINKILLAQANIKYVPYRSGKPYKSGVFQFDIKNALFQLICTGACVIWKKEIVGFAEKELYVLNTANIIETYDAFRNKYTYTYQEGNLYTTIPNEQLIIIVLQKNPWCQESQFGIGALQAAQFPVDTLKEMWTYDGSLLKNKGGDVIISAKTDMPLMDEEKIQQDLSFARRAGGSRNAGKAIISNSQLDIKELGRTPKELSLWDGYKVKVRSLAVAMQIDPSILGDTDSKTFANRNEAEKALYTSCIIPYVGVILNDPRLVKELTYSVFLDTSGIECLQDDKKLRAETSAISTENIIKLNEAVKSGNITKDIAVLILKTDWGYDEEEAKMMIIDTKAVASDVADRLSALSAIVATKVIDSATTNERRDMAGLPKIAEGDTIPQDAPRF
jgi:hypothetical protein